MSAKIRSAEIMTAVSRVYTGVAVKCGHAATTVAALVNAVPQPVCALRPIAQQMLALSAPERFIAPLPLASVVDAATCSLSAVQPIVLVQSQPPSLQL